MNHQDWTPVVLKNPNAKKNNEVKKPHKQFTKEVDIEENPMKFVSNELKAKIIKARTTYSPLHTDKIGLTQKEFATLIKVKESDIKMLEQGKMEMKKAKQIALAIEKHIKIKILTK